MLLQITIDKAVLFLLVGHSSHRTTSNSGGLRYILQCLQAQVRRPLVHSSILTCWEIFTGCSTVVPCAIIGFSINSAICTPVRLSVVAHWIITHLAQLIVSQHLAHTLGFALRHFQSPLDVSALPLNTSIANHRNLVGTVMVWLAFVMCELQVSIRMCTC